MMVPDIRPVDGLRNNAYACGMLVVPNVSSACGVDDAAVVIRTHAIIPTVDEGKPVSGITAHAETHGTRRNGSYDGFTVEELRFSPTRRHCRTFTGCVGEGCIASCWAGAGRSVCDKQREQGQAEELSKHGKSAGS